MKNRTVMLAGLAVILGLCLTGCSKKEKAATQLDPHSPEALNDEIQIQQTLLSAAFDKGDLIYVHRKMYYIETLADTLSHKLIGQEKKPRVDAIIVNLKQATEQLDRSAGRQLQAATAASLTNLFAAMKKLDAEFKAPIARNGKK